MTGRRVLLIVLVGSLGAWLAGAGLCEAEIVFFSTGRTMSVKSHRYDGESVVLSLRGGGEITCTASLVDRIGPDEVARPEPEFAPVPAPDPTVPFGAVIDEAAARSGVDPRLVRAVIQVESAYRPTARSRKGAMGLMQLMPDTARRYDLANPYDPAGNIDAGVRHLKTLLDRFDVSLALAAYNAGEAAVERFGGIPPFPETQNYVQQVLRLLRGSR